MKTDEIIDDVINDYLEKKNDRYVPLSELVKNIKARFNQGTFIDFKDACPVCKEQYNYTPICDHCGRIPLIDV